MVRLPLNAMRPHDSSTGRLGRAHGSLCPRGPRQTAGALSPAWRSGVTALPRKPDRARLPTSPRSRSAQCVITAAPAVDTLLRPIGSPGRVRDQAHARRSPPNMSFPETPPPRDLRVLDNARASRCSVHSSHCVGQTPVVGQWCRAGGPRDGRGGSPTCARVAALSHRAVRGRVHMYRRPRAHGLRSSVRRGTGIQPFDHPTRPDR